MFVYRVEHKDTKEGPYSHCTNGRITCSKLYWRHNSYLVGNEKPGFEDERFHNLKNSDKYNCGCVTLEKLFTWFDNFVDYLHEMQDFYIVEYKISSKYVRFGRTGKQCAFIRDKATVVSAKLIKEYV